MTIKTNRSLFTKLSDRFSNYRGNTPSSLKSLEREMARVVLKAEKTKDAEKLMDTDLVAIESFPLFSIVEDLLPDADKSDFPTFDEVMTFAKRVDRSKSTGGKVPESPWDSFTFAPEAQETIDACYAATKANRRNKSHMEELLETAEDLHEKLSGEANELGFGRFKAAVDFARVWVDVFEDESERLDDIAAKMNLKNSAERQSRRTAAAVNGKKSVAQSLADFSELFGQVDPKDLKKVFAGIAAQMSDPVVVGE